jgi:hypothetical protein
MKSNNQTKSTGRGGKRPGSGRKAGSATKKTREIADRAAAEGITPLEVMLKTMRALVERAEKLGREKPVPGEKPAVTPLELMVEAASVAKDAAPYMHPRLAAIEHSGPNGGPIEGKTTLDVGSLSMDQLRALASIRLNGE